ncbi:MAG: DUF1538 domain-containing protein [Planctomycetota bacterium]|jgi:hypothetical protein
MEGLSFGLLLETVLATLIDVAPIVGVLFFYQLIVLRHAIPRIRRVLVGLIYVVFGLAMFLVGLEVALFPIGKIMASQLTDPSFLGAGAGTLSWNDYGWVYLFAFAIGFSTTIAEPSLIAIAMKASDVSGGAIRSLGLRIAVAIGVAAAIAVGALRIVTGTPLYLYMIVGYAVVVVQTMFAPKEIVPLAYDSGGVTTSTVTVPLVAALGLGLAGSVPGRSALIDGFGLIALASLFPMISVMGYAQIGAYTARRASRRAERSKP